VADFRAGLAVFLWQPFCAPNVPCARPSLG